MTTHLRSSSKALLRVIPRSARIRYGSLGALAVAVAVATIVVVVTALDGLGRTRGPRGARVRQRHIPAGPNRHGRQSTRRELAEKQRRNPAMQGPTCGFLERHAGEDVIYAVTVQRVAMSPPVQKYENAAISGTTPTLADLRDIGSARAVPAAARGRAGRAGCRHRRGHRRRALSGRRGAGPGDSRGRPAVRGGGRPAAAGRPAAPPSTVSCGCRSRVRAHLRAAADAEHLRAGKDGVETEVAESAARTASVRNASSNPAWRTTSTS